MNFVFRPLARFLRPESNSGRQTVAWALAFAILAIGFLARSPEAHHELHADADHAGHACAVTLSDHGYCDTAATPPVVAQRHAAELSVVSASTEHTWTRPDFWQPFAQAPPSDVN